MKKVYLNNMKYRYDVYQIVDLFISFNKFSIISDDEDCDYKVIINLDSNTVEVESIKSKEIFNMDSKGRIKEEVKKAVFKFFSSETGVNPPWGIMIGIRPTKIPGEMIKEGKDYEYIKKYLFDHYLLDERKADLCINVAKNEVRYTDFDKNKISVYIDMPFCPSRCSYCSFITTTISHDRKLVDPYLKWLSYEISHVSSFIDKMHLDIENVYFGGGTPTSIDASQFGYLMSNIYKSFIKGRNVREFTLECGRPDSIDEEKLHIMKECGVKRISINPQTMNDKTLRLVGRKHTSSDIVEKYYLARKMGFDDINMDLILGLPEEGIPEVEKTCRSIEKLSPDSITIHGLTIKKGSKLREEMLYNEDEDIRKSSDIINKMYERTSELAKRLDMAPYYMYRQKNMVGNLENVGYSKKGKEGIYNIKMIQESQNIFALGTGAVSKLIYPDTNRIERFPNVKDVKEYIIRCSKVTEEKIKIFSDYYLRSEF